ncbi:adenylyl-sulfate kinase [Marinicellulosiphila megalodicopiae]|uniref:adenylyl-sulfate kinase n=1 Tax=Marinicellulosiphila megalodicopiae TaxID=2724896 RepID=UPI003BAF0191
MTDPNIKWQDITINNHQRAEQKKQTPCTLWFTGLSGAGKSTIANLVEQALYLRGHHSFLLDGDNVRHGLNQDLGFSDTDRIENVRRVGEISKLFNQSGLIVLSAFISPFRSERELVRQLHKEHHFIEVFVDTPLKDCEQRDPKGLYKKARSGEIKNFTGIDSDYEAPLNPEIHLCPGSLNAKQCAQVVIDYLIKHQFLKPMHLVSSQTSNNVRTQFSRSTN